MISASSSLTSDEQNVSADDVLALEQAKQNVNFGFTINPLIQQYINYYQGRGRSTMESGLRRSGQYMKMARQIFKEEGVPVDITWLGQVESAWKPKAMSWAAASGLWQFIPSTGRRFGLRQTAWIDERNSFEQATRASAKYLKIPGQPLQRQLGTGDGRLQHRRRQHRPCASHARAQQISGPSIPTLLRKRATTFPTSWRRS